MKLTGKHEFDAAPDDVYARLLDPERLRHCMPGCERLDPIREGEFAVTLVPPIPAIKGEFSGTVKIFDQAPPQSFRMRIEATGKAGFVNADAEMRIEPGAASTSVVHYTADAQVGGAAAAVGQRVLTGITRRQVDQMMRCLAAGPAAKKVGLFARIGAWLRSKFGRKQKAAAPSG
jgi:carbon monoxide dehydrogenase subunit G